MCMVILFLAGVGNCHLYGSTELRVAGITAEMEKTGDVIVPMLNGEPFLEKPPLYFWIGSTTFNLFGKNSYTARLPSAIAAICGVAIVFFIARSMGFSAFVAFISGFILATFPGYWAYGRTCSINMLLCLFTTCAMACFFCAGRTLSKRALWYAGFVMSLSCAVMTKGLVGIAIPSCSLAVWLFLEKNFSFRAWGLLLLGSVFCLIPAAVWIWFLHDKLGWDAVYEVVWTNNFGRFSGSHHSHIEPFFYYVTRFPQKLFPWVIFLPFALFCHLLEIHNHKKKILFVLSWLIVPYILLSISAAKRSCYLLPLYPAAALLIGTAVGNALEKTNKQLTKWFYVPSAIFAGCIGIISIAFFGICFYFKQSLIICIIVSLPCLCLSIWACHKFAKKDMTAFIKILAASMIVIFSTFSIWVEPLLQHGNSYEDVFKYAEKLESKGIRISLFQPSERIRGAAVLYMGKTVPVIRKVEMLKNFLSSGKGNVAILRKNEVKKLDNVDIIKKFNIGCKTIIFVED